MARSGRRKKVPAFKKQQGPVSFETGPCCFSEKGEDYADSMVSHTVVETGVDSWAE